MQMFAATSILCCADFAFEVSERCASATSCFAGKLEGFAEHPFCKSFVRFCVGFDGELSFQFATVGDAIGHVSVDRGCGGHVLDC